MEIWKDVTGYDGIYQVSNLGNVRSLPLTRKMKNGVERSYEGKMLNPSESKDGYLVVDLSVDGKRKTTKIHRMVAEAFVNNPLNLPVVNHKNENKHDNRASNLEWCSIRYNLRYGTTQKRRAHKIGWKVRMFSEEGKYIKTFATMRAASRILKLPMSGIYQSVLTKKAYKGYLFRKVDEEN